MGGLLIVSMFMFSDPGFRSDVAPVLARRCVGCHGGQKPRGGYSLETWASLNEAGKSGMAPVVPGKPGESPLFTRLTESDSKRRMPPDDEPLSPSEIAAMGKWIAGGARFDGPDKAAAIQTYLPPRNHPPAPARYPGPVPVFAVAFAPGGKVVAAGGVNEVTLWDPENGRLLGRLPGLPARIQALAYSPDGSALLVGGGSPGEYGEVVLVNPDKPESRKPLGVFPDIVLAAAFSSDGKAVVAGGADRAARAFATASGKELWRASFHADWVTAAAFSPDGRFVATASRDRTVKVLDASTGKLFTTFNGHRRQYGPHTGQFEVYGVAFDTGGIAYSAGGGTAVRVWEPLKAQEENGSAIDMEARFAKAGHTRYLEYASGRPVFGLAWAGGRVFTATGDGKVRRHEPNSGKQELEYAGANEWLYCVAASPATRRVAAAGFDGVLRIWNWESGDLVASFPAAPGFSR